MPITVEWLGHCCFRLQGDNRTRILIDPFDDTIGLDVPEYDCEVLMISHNHYDSSARHLVKSGYELVSRKGTTFAHGMAFNGFPWWHDDRLGKDFGSVYIFLFELDGFKIGYLSHIGCVPGRWMFDYIKNLDLCFIPVGGNFALGPTDARFLVGEISPRFVIPMHFNLPHLNFTLLPITEFTRIMPRTLEVRDCRIEIDRGEIPDSPTVLLMEHNSVSHPR